MSLFQDALSIAKAEGGLFRRFPKLRMSVAGIILIPALYSFIYLSSVWDPASRTGALPAVIVNLDGGINYRGQQVNLGQDLAASLAQKHTFGFVTATDEAAARKAVRDGTTAFALIIPRDFSANAVPGAQTGGGKLVVFASEGNNYTGAGLARRFAAELGHQVNETLNEKRWSLVLGTSEGARQSLARLRDGVAQLRSGAHTLDQGLGQARTGATQLAGASTRLADGVTQVSGGMKQLAAGVREMDAKKPAAQDLQALKTGGTQLAAGGAELERGLAELQKGAQKLADGAARMRDETKSIPLVGGKVSAGAAQLADGGQQLGTGLQQAHGAQVRLAQGSQQLSAGVNTLTDGMARLGEGIGTMAARLPPDAKLDELSAGGVALAGGAKALDEGMGKLHAGSRQLSAGLDLLDSSLPAQVDGLEGSAKGLAVSVEPAVEIDAPVPNNGTGFAPNFVPVSLWLGAVMTSFIFHLRRLPLQAQGKSRFAQVLGKLGIPGCIVLAQAAVILAMLTLILDVRVANLPGLGFTVALASMTFMLIILALTRAFGDAGKAVGLILLIVQLSSAGGIFPVELTGAFFRDVSPWLPFTWVVKGIRASMFGAYGSEWLSSLGVVAAAALVTLGVATFAGRWKYVGPEEHRPAMDI